MKKLLLIWLALSLVLTGCTTDHFFPKAKDFRQLAMVRIFAVDQGKEDVDNVRVTVVLKKVSGNDQGGGAGGSMKSGEGMVLTEEDVSIAAAAKKLQSYTDQELFYGHADFYLIGESAAKTGLNSYLDYIARDNDFRLNGVIYITHGDALTFLKDEHESNNYLPDYLKNFLKKIDLSATSYTLRFLDLLSQLSDSATSAIAVPAIQKVKKTETESASEPADASKPEGSATPIQENAEISTDSYAVIRDNKLLYFTRRVDSEGYNIIRNEVDSEVLRTQLENGKTVALNMVSSHSSITPEVRDGQLDRVVIRTEVSAKVLEMQTEVTELSEPILIKLQDDAASNVRRKMETCVQKAQSTGADFIGIGPSINAKSPKAWDALKPEWNENFRTISITVEVFVKIDMTSVIKDPAKSKE